MFTDNAAWVEWVWWGTRWALFVGAVTLVQWALFWDRARGRRRCGSCWYDMSGGGSGGGLVCPECGRAAKGERGLLRTRRRWKFVALGVLVGVAGVQAGEQPARVREGWTRVVPTTVLVFLARPRDASGAAAPGSPNASPINSAIVGRSVGGWRGAVAEWRTCELNDTTAAKAVVTRRRWPVGVPSEVLVEYVSELGPEIGWRTLKAWPDADEAKVGLLYLEPLHTWGCGLRSAPPPRSFALPDRPVGSYHEPVTVSVESQRWEVARRGVTVSYDVVGTMDEAIAPMDSEELRGTVRDALAAAGTKNEAETSVSYSVWWRKRVAPFEWTELTIEVVIDDRVVLTVEGDDLFYVAKTGSPRDHAGELVVYADAADVDEYARANVRLRVRGNQARTLTKNLSADAYWAGVFEVPLSELLDTRR